MAIIKCNSMNSLRKAIRQAKDGDVISIAPGHYRPRKPIVKPSDSDKNITIDGHGKAYFDYSGFDGPAIDHSHCEPV